MVAAGFLTPGLIGFALGDDLSTLATFGPYQQTGAIANSEFNGKAGLLVALDDEGIFVDNGVLRGSLLSAVATVGGNAGQSRLTEADGDKFNNAVNQLTDDTFSFLISTGVDGLGFAATLNLDTPFQLAPNVHSLITNDIKEILLTVSVIDSAATIVSVTNLDFSVIPPRRVVVEEAGTELTLSYTLELRGIPEPAAALAVCFFPLITLRRRRGGFQNCP